MAWILVTVDLHLPIGNRLVLPSNGLMIIVMVNFLGCRFQNGNERLRVISDVHGQVLIEVDEELQVNVDEVATFSCISLQLLSI